MKKSRLKRNINQQETERKKDPDQNDNANLSQNTGDVDIREDRNFFYYKLRLHIIKNNMPRGKIRDIFS